MMMMMMMMLMMMMIDDDDDDVVEVRHTFALFPAAAETKVSESLFNISHNLFTLA